MNECKNTLEKTIIDMQVEKATLQVALFYLQRDIYEYEKTNVLDKEMEKEFLSRFQSILKGVVKIFGDVKAEELSNLLKKEIGFSVKDIINY